MNREIKFRAWDTDSNKWVTKYVCIHADGRFFIGNALPEDHIILIQFTGLKEKNGKEIYEGDIVSSQWNDRREVLFHKGLFCYKVNTNEYHIFDETQVEVIGNIYENPDLLKN